MYVIWVYLTVAQMQVPSICLWHPMAIYIYMCVCVSRTFGLLYCRSSQDGLLPSANPAVALFCIIHYMMQRMCFWSYPALDVKECKRIRHHRHSETTMIVYEGTPIAGETAWYCKYPDVFDCFRIRLC